MSDAHSSRSGRPRAELVTFAEPEWPPGHAGRGGLPAGAAEVLFASGVPRRFLGYGYRADSRLEFVAALGPGAGYLRFGSTGISDPVALDLATGAVVELVGQPPVKALFVNSGAGLFVRTVQDLLDGFPRYTAEADDAELEAAGAAVRRIVAAIDPPAAEDGTYWGTIADGVGIGDFSVELVDGEHPRAVWR